MVKSRCKNLLHENNLIIKNKNKKLEKVSVEWKNCSVSHVCVPLTPTVVLSLRHFPSACLGVALRGLCESSVFPLEEITFSQAWSVVYLWECVFCYSCLRNSVNVLLFWHRSKGPIIYYWDLSAVRCKLVSFLLFFFLHFLFLKKLQSKISLVNAFWEEKWYLENPLLLFTRLRQEQEKPVLAGDGVFVNIFSF